MSEPALRWESGLRPVLLVLWLFGLGVAAYYSLMPAAKLGHVPGSDKAWHCMGYAILAAPLPLLFRNVRLLCIVSAGLIVFGILLEFGQEFVPGRSFEVADMLANSAGVIVSVLIVDRMEAIRQSRWPRIAVGNGRAD